MFLQLGAQGAPINFSLDDEAMTFCDSLMPS